MNFEPIVEHGLLRESVQRFFERAFGLINLLQVQVRNALVQRCNGQLGISFRRLPKQV